MNTSSNKYSGRLNSKIVFATADIQKSSCDLYGTTILLCAAIGKFGATDLKNCQMLCKTHNRTKRNA